VLAQLNTTEEFVYHAARKSYIINPTLARPKASREGEAGTHDNVDSVTTIYHGSTPLNLISWGDE
jgi:hypothetical protein